MKIKNVHTFFQPYKYLGPVENGGGHLCSLVAVIVNCQLKVISSEQLCNQYNAHLAQHDHVRLLLLCQLGQILLTWIGWKKIKIGPLDMNFPSLLNVSLLFSKQTHNQIEVPGKNKTAQFFASLSLLC